MSLDVPNAGRKLVTLPKRMQWDPEFKKLVKDLDSKKPVIICGDMNVAHQEIGTVFLFRRNMSFNYVFWIQISYIFFTDIANPKSNKRNAGFTQEERDGFSELLKSAKLTDCFRYKYPELKQAYTFWTYMANARIKNIGW